jgi:hypothetical protein
MVKEIIIVVLIPSLLSMLTGCYTMTSISKEDIKKTPTTKLWVMTNEGDSYMFADNSYQIRNDTLMGRPSNGNQFGVRKTIPLDDISMMQTEKINGGSTALVVIGVIAGVAVLAAIIAGSLFLSDVHDVTHQ